MSKNGNFEPPYKRFFREIAMFGSTRKKYHYGSTFIQQKIQKSGIKVFQLNTLDVPTMRRLRFEKCLRALYDSCQVRLAGKSGLVNSALKYLGYLMLSFLENLNFENFKELS